jgi:hypothetical protein
LDPNNDEYETYKDDHFVKRIFARLGSNPNNDEYEHQWCFLKTYKDDHFVKRIWNAFARLDALFYYTLIDVTRRLCAFKWRGMVNDSFNFLLSSIVVKAFNLFSTPEFKIFRYDKNKNMVHNLYNLFRKTIKQVTTVEIPKSRKGCLVFGFLFFILPEFIFRKVVLGPLFFIALGLLWMTSWVGVLILIPLACLLWYIIKLVSKIILVFLALVTATVLAICVLLVPAMYFVFMAIFALTVGGIVLLTPLFLGLRAVILTVIALVYYIFRPYSLCKSCFFVPEESVPV